MKKALPLVIALILGLVAMFGVQNYLKKINLDFEKKNQPKTIVVLSQNVLAGERLTKDVLSKRDFPAKMLPENVVTPQDLKDVLNQPVNRDVFAGESLLWSYLGSEKMKGSLSQVIELEERAISISCNNISGVDGYIQPNDKIDIYIITEIPYKKKQLMPKESGEMVEVEVDEQKSVAFLLLQNVTVLATGSSFGQGGMVETQQAYSTITLSATPQEAGLLKFAGEVGSLSMALRNPKDFSESSKIEIIDMDSIIDVARLKEVQQARKKRIEVYNQGKAQLIER
ncbi:MAG: hypothetical protein ACD_79C01234G0007 [uncultured bacterium]|nr:MAG: hypothetical protein ACD_79C01234G0007 [uncultured bacterium]